MSLHTFHRGHRVLQINVPDSGSPDMTVKQVRAFVAIMRVALVLEEHKVVGIDQAMLGHLAPTRALRGRELQEYIDAWAYRASSAASGFWFAPEGMLIHVRPSIDVNLVSEPGNGMPRSRRTARCVDVLVQVTDPHMKGVQQLLRQALERAAGDKIPEDIEVHTGHAEHYMRLLGSSSAA